MSTTEQINRVSAGSIFAALLKIARNDPALPDMTELEPTGNLMCITVATVADVHAWVSALGGNPADVESIEFSSVPLVRHVCNVRPDDESGWWYQVRANISTAEAVA